MFDRQESVKETQSKGAIDFPEGSDRLQIQDAIYSLTHRMGTL